MRNGHRFRRHDFGRVAGVTAQVATLVVGGKAVGVSAASGELEAVAGGASGVVVPLQLTASTVAVTHR